MKAKTRRIATVAHPVMLAARPLRLAEPLLVLGWHRVDRIGGGVSTRHDVFEGQLDALEDWGAAVLPLEEALRLLEAGRLPKRAVCLTFDDGYTSVIDTVWPMLCKRHFPATFYVVTDYLDGTRYFEWDADGASDPRAHLVTADAVREVHRDGMAIGSHTATHPWLPHLSPHQVDVELRRSREGLEDLLGARVDSLAYPKGGWSRLVRDAAARAGYLSAVTTDRGVNSRRRDHLLLRRTLVPDSVDDFRLVLDGAYDWLRPLDRWRIRKGPVW